MPKKPGRPKKKGADRKTVDLRIPVTTRQKALIYAALAGESLAAICEKQQHEDLC